MKAEKECRGVGGNGSEEGQQISVGAQRRSRDGGRKR